MTDRVIIAGAVAIAAAAWWRPAVPLAVALALALLAVAVAPKRAVLVVLAAAATSAALAGRAWSGLDPGLERRTPVRGIATLVGDPVRVPGGVRVDLRVAGMRLRAVARHPIAGRVAVAAAGQRLRIEGTYTPLDATSRARLASRHIGGRLQLVTAEHVDNGAVLWRVSNAVRSRLMRGAVSLPPDRAALFAGVVLGDDREQDPADVEDFRAAGLSHLLAVSGQNVAFTLGLFAPLVRRLSLRGRLAAGIGILLAFGTVTRWEPSVLRATAMAFVTMIAATLGRPVTPLRVLALASGALVLIDPLLVRSVGFALSVAACAGIAVVAPKLAERLPQAVAVTVAAQCAVAPLLLSVFGPVPLAAVPANVAAAPVAGPLMMWGASAGLFAGFLGGPAAAVVHIPTRAMLWWLSGVARVGARLPLAWVTPKTAVALVGIAAAVAVASRARPAPRVWAALGAGALLASIAPACIVADLHAEALTTGGRDRVWRRDGSVVLVSDGRAPPGRLLGELRLRGIRRIDILVVTQSSSSGAMSLAPVIARMATSLVLAPADHQIATAIAVETPIEARSGPYVVAVRPDGGGPKPRLTVRIGST